jgi:acetyltransferase-like isoleucine patch superfamily enzyme
MKWNSMLTRAASLILRLLLFVPRRVAIVSRRRLWTAVARLRVAEAGPGLRVNGRSVLTRTTHLGCNVHFNGMTIAGTGRVRIGDNFHSGRRCFVLTDNHRYEGDRLPYDATVVVRHVTIGDNVWLGDQVLVLPGAEIGEGAVIQAGSVVVGRIPPLTVAGGNPARPFRTRDAERYERLKAANAFH